MSQTFAAALRSWSFDPLLVAALVVAAFVYLRGFRGLAVLHPERFPRWRRNAFLGGLTSFLFATASPLDAFSDLLLQAHMAQHLLLMFVAPPLIWLGAPANPILHGLPRGLLRRGFGPFLGWPALHRVAAFAVHPVTAWLGFTATLWFWHAPALYQLALRDPFWHVVEHLCFFGAALCFWFPVVQPWPSRGAWPRAAVLPYLALMGLQMTVFSATFAFSQRTFYPRYAELPGVFGVSPLADQQAAGALMWVPGSIVLLLAITLIAVRTLDTPLRKPRAPGDRAAVRSLRPARFDLLRVRGVGPLLRSRRFRVGAQSVLFALAAAIVLDGWFGPDLANRNLAGVLPWTWWRGLAVIGLLVAGNLVCFACPFTLPRKLARRLLGGRRETPALLRNKWLAVAAFGSFLVAYEVFDLWDGPWWTAWVIVGYFCAAFALDGLYGRATFCRSLCPIGQFQFVGATLSPLEVAPRSEATCTNCSSHDCLRGGPAGPGCDLDLFQPAKVGNLDCTFCLDCVRACPHDNVGLQGRVPGLELVSDAPRAGVGRLSGRADLAAFARLFAIGAFVNAAAMVAPVAAFEREIARRLELGEGPVVFALLLAALVAIPFLLTSLAVRSGNVAAGEMLDAPERRRLERRFSFALIPLGFSMWLAHFSFHLVTAGGAWRDVSARIQPLLPKPSQGMALTPDALVAFEIVALGLGLQCSLFIAWKLALDRHGDWRRSLGRFTPWAVVACGLWAVGLWIVFQPMEMRGLAPPAMGGGMQMGLGAAVEMGAG